MMFYFLFFFLWLPKKLSPVRAKPASVIRVNAEKVEHVALLGNGVVSDGDLFCVLSSL